jgi:hypothetical protein
MSCRLGEQLAPVLFSLFRVEHCGISVEALFESVGVASSGAVRRATGLGCNEFSGLALGEYFVVSTQCSFHLWREVRSFAAGQWSARLNQRFHNSR